MPPDQMLRDTTNPIATKLSLDFISDVCFFILRLQNYYEFIKYANKKQNIRKIPQKFAYMRKML